MPALISNLEMASYQRLPLGLHDYSYHLDLAVRDSRLQRLALSHLYSNRQYGTRRQRLAQLSTFPIHQIPE